MNTPTTSSDATLTSAETLVRRRNVAAVRRPIPLPDYVGHYEVRGFLGEGGMARVYRAVDPGSGREVAVKVLKDEVACDETAAKRFRREAEAAARFRHPALVAVQDVGPTFIVLDLVDGESLAALLARRGGLPAAEALRILGEVAGALDHVHAQGVVHRDVKPSNVLVARDGGAKLTDFGIARLAWARMTRTGELIGSPAYMAPEQITHGKVAPATDLYALGVVAFEALTGERAFPHTGLADQLLKVAYGKPPSARRIRPDLPHEVDGVLARALAREPADRFRSARAFVAALAHALGPAVRPPSAS